MYYNYIEVYKMNEKVGKVITIIMLVAMLATTVASLIFV